jgi:hypothetical protein
MALPERPKPLKVTILPVPTFFVSKAAALLEAVSTSVPKRPRTLRLPVAVVLAL